MLLAGMEIQCTCFIFTQDVRVGFLSTERSNTNVKRGELLLIQSANLFRRNFIKIIYTREYVLGEWEQEFI